MRPDDNLFRSAVMGGFNREDVTAYLEKMSAQHSKELEELRQTLQQAEAARDAAESEAAELKTARQMLQRRVEELAETERGLEQQRQELQQQLTARAAELEELHRSLQERESQTAAAVGELSAMKAQVTVLAEVQRALAQKSEALNRLEMENCDLRAHQALLQADAEAYRAVKDRVAGIELEAHQRAQEAEDTAARHAAETRREMEAWLEEARQEYHALRSAMDAAVGRTRTELNTLAESADKIAERFASGEGALEGIASRYGAAVTLQMPESLELDEE